MRMLHLILPRRIPSRRRLVNIMKGDFLAGDPVQDDGPELLVVPREAQVHPMMTPVTVAGTKLQAIAAARPAIFLDRSRPRTFCTSAT
jgi:hypothetical protein